jgi:hypothetical protein
LGRRLMSRQTDYTEELADTICERIADGESLRSICLDEDMPNKATVFRWLADPEREAFRDQYARARECQADGYVDEAVDIADTPQEGVKTKTMPDGKIETTTGDMIEHRRLQIDARKWAAAKLHPKKYGDKLALTDPDGGPLMVNVVQRAERKPSP